jgi:hypothetical protein
MAKQVSMSTVKLEVATVTTAPEFRVTEGSRVVGDFRVSVGGAFWRPRNGQQYLHLSWEEVDALFKEKGTLRSVGEYKFATPTGGGFDDAPAPSMDSSPPA